MCKNKQQDQEPPSGTEGAADTVTALAFTRLDLLLEFLRENALPG